MTSRNYLLKSITGNLRRNLWLIILFFLGFFAVGPVRLLVSLDAARHTAAPYPSGFTMDEGEDTRSIREKFNGAVVVGDSIAQGFTEFDVLNTSSVVSKIGVHLYELDDLISQVKEISPGTVFLAMGMNDLSATEGNVDEFISQYTEVLNKVAEEVPDANVFVNSIFPAQENAIEDDPYLEHISEYNTALKELCDSRGIGFIDNTNLVEDKYYEEDGLHFKADFYPLWAEHMAEVAAL